MSEPLSKLCHCGQPQHYPSPEVQRYVETQIAQLGETVPVLARDDDGEWRRWKVPRQFIAAHGIKSEELCRLGFDEVIE